MKIHVPNHNALTRALLQTIKMFENQEEVKQLAEADIVLTTNLDELRKIHQDDKFFGLIATRYDGVRKDQPENVFVLDGADLIHGENGASAFKKAFEVWHSTTETGSSDERDAQKEASTVSNLATLSRSYSVLIIDDSEENLSLAIRLLPGQQICPVRKVEEAVRLLRMEGKTFDVVLTDMHMPPDKTYGSLNLDTYGIKETVPYGFAMVLEATKRGIPVAVVTDANHHQDWVSAMFDHIKEATVNGQKVLFCNHLGKRWDRALELLMEPKDK
jgi:CheY-like chemotaxis protein